MQFSMNFSNGVFELKTSGDARVDQFEKLLDSMLSHEQWNPGISILHDHSDLNAGPLTVNEIKDIANMCVKRSDRIGEARCAVVVSRDLEFGLARMWATYVEGRWQASARIFRSRNEAIDWLTDRKEYTAA